MWICLTPACVVTMILEQAMRGATGPKERDLVQVPHPLAGTWSKLCWNRRLKKSMSRVFYRYVQLNVPQESTIQTTSLPNGFLEYDLRLFHFKSFWVSNDLCAWLQLEASFCSILASQGLVVAHTGEGTLYHLSLSHVVLPPWAGEYRSYTSWVHSFLGALGLNMLLAAFCFCCIKWLG